MRQLRLRMSDETVRTVMVDENQPVANLMVLICTKLGITNHDEYSLIATGKHTIDGRRRERQDGRFIDQKMEQLKKKLKTDEDLAWVDHSKTLDEQDIHEQDIVLLRRRFFYSDQNVDSRDPIQLGLLYVQTRDAILKGTYSVTVDGACKFAGLQCQAQLGDFVEGHHSRPGFLNLKDFLPADYAKIKHIERRVFQEHKKYLGLSDVEAKARYVGEARALPFYGVTFFLVKEQVTGKSKLVPRLLGITRDCVMVVDADTKGVLKTWPLTTVKRWAPSPNSFTLDFGDYSNSYYSVQTSEGEQISQLIAGYIDIILRRRKAKDHFGIEGDEGATMIEDSVAPSRAKIIQNAPPRPPSAGPPADSQLDLASSTGPNVQKQLYAQGPQLEPPEFRPAVEIRGKAEIGYESRPLTQYVTNYELTLPQRDLQDRLEQAQDAVEEAQRVLDQRSAPIAGELGGRERERARHQHLEAREVEQKTRKLSSQFAEINAATAQLVSLSAIPEEELNYPALNSAVETVASNLPSVAKEVKIVASLMEDEESGERLMEAARHLCKAFSDLLNAAKPGPTVPRQSLISAASRVGDATQALLQTINQGGLAGGPQEGQLQAQQQLEEERETADQLLALAKSVASSAAALVLKTKDVASTCRDKELQNLVIGSATQCALATSQMVATAKIVAPTIHDPNCKRQLIDACREVQRAVEGIQSACERALRDEQSLCSVNEAVERVQHALAELTEHVRTISRRRQLHTTTSTTTTTTTTQNDHRSSHNTTLHRIHDQSSGRLIEPAVPGEPERPDPAKSELVQQARTLARATAQLIQDIRPEAPERYQNAQWRSSSPERQQQQQQYHDGTNKTTTTITTTLYDDQQQQQQRAGGSSLRPVSVYESESSPAPHHNYGPANGRYLSGGGGAQLDERSQQQQQRSTTTSQTTRTTTIEEHSSAGWHGEPPLAAHHDQHQYQGQYQGQSQAGEQPAEAAISGIIGDLETTIMFATAGTLRAQDEHDSYLAHRENVLRCAKALVEDTRPLVAGAPGDQQQLVQAAQESVFTMGRLADTVKSSAASLGPNNADSQVSLIRSVKDVAVSLADLIGSTKSASQEGASSVQLKDSAKTMVTSVTSLLKTVKSVEEEQQRGVRAIEAALEAIEQELVNYASQCAYEDSAPGAPARCSPDELQRTTRPVTMATAKTVHAASSGVQDDAIVAANMGRKAIVDLLRASRSASFAAASYEARARVQEAGRQCAVNYKRLVELLHRIFQHPSHASANPEIKQELIGQSKTIAGCVQELVSCSELLLPPSGAPQQQHPQHQMLASTTITTTTTSTSNNNNSNSNIINSSSLDASSNLGGLRDAPAHGAPDWADPDDPTVIAESELLGAASSIDAAAKKLENLKPRVTSVKVSL